MATKKATKKQKIETTKSDLTGFKGGLPVNLDRKMEGGGILRDVLSQHLKETLLVEKDNAVNLREDISRWQKQYDGKKPPKSFPFENCANVAVPVSRSRTDIAHVRLIESIFSRKKIVIVKAMKKEFIEWAKKIEEAFNHFLKHTIKLKRILNSPLLQCTKIGTGVVKLDHIEKKRAVYRYATPAEVADPSIHKYDTGEKSDKAVKYIETSYRGPTIYPIDRADFIISSDATSMDDAYLVGFRFRLRRPQIELKIRQGLYDREQADLITSPTEPSEGQKTRAELQGKELKKTEYEKPHEFCELWFDYDVDEDGEEDSIMVVFHEPSGAILRAIYNPIFKQFRPFQEFVFYPVEHSFDGKGILPILENLQVQLDTIVNQRLDRLTQINCPWYLVKEGSNLAKRIGNRMKPGEIVVEDDDLDKVLREVKFSDATPQTVMEEDRTIRHMDEAIGVTADIMGVPTSDRPVFRETMAHLGEAYKKFNYGAENVRENGMVELFYKLLEIFAQYQPSYTYSTKEGAVIEEKTVDFPVTAIRDGFNITLFASSDEINQDARREKNMTVYQILKDYMTGIAGMGQFITNQMVPSDFKRLLIKANEISAKMLTRVFDDFDVRDADDLVLDIAEIIDIQKALAQSIDMIPEEQRKKMMMAQQQQQAQEKKPAGGEGG
jgi:hypothetical protein